MTMMLGIALAAIAVVWAFLLAPVSQQLVVPTLREVPLANASPVGEFNAGAFAARIWDLPPQPSERPPDAPSPQQKSTAPAIPPFRLQLIGIISEDGRPLCAAFYDPDQDCLLLLHAGDAASGRTIASVDEAGVELLVGDRVERVVLDPHQSHDAGGRRP